MSEERLQEIKDSIEFQYTLAKAKGYDNALLFTNEEEELVEEIERLNNIINELEKWLEVNLTNLEKEKANNTYDKGLKQGMLSNGRLIKNKLQELKGSDKK